MNPSIQALENQYMLLRNSLPELEARCETEDQRSTLRKAVAQSRDNYSAAIRSILHDDDPDVAALTSQMNTIQLTLDQTVKHWGDIAKVLNGITKAVDIGSQLAAKAVAV
jgi:predicted DNA-binding protein (UPF0278 family)